MEFSIFMASRTITSSPAFTRSPTFTFTSITRPGSGAMTAWPVMVIGCSSAAGAASATSTGFEASYALTFSFVRNVFATSGKSSSSSTSFSSAASFTPPASGSSGFGCILYFDVSYGVSSRTPQILNRNSGSIFTGVLPYSPFTSPTNCDDLFEYIGRPAFSSSAQFTACAPTICDVGVTSGGSPAARRTVGISSMARGRISSAFSCLSCATMFEYMPPGISAF